MTTFKTKKLDKVFEALGHQHRREIVYALALQPHSISQLAAMRELSLPAIHKHIKVLEDAGLLIHKKIGRTHFLSINRTSLIGLQDWLTQFQAYWGNDNETLENYATYLNGGLPLRSQTSKNINTKIEERNPTSLKLRGARGGEKKK